MTYTKRYWIGFMFMCLSCGVLKAQEVTQLSLQQATETALSKNYDIQKAKIDYKLNRLQTKDVITQGLPKISGRAEFAAYFRVPQTVIPKDSDAALLFAERDSVGRPIPPSDDLTFSFVNPYNFDAVVELNQLIIDGRYFVGLKARKSLNNVFDLQLNLTMDNKRMSVHNAYYVAALAQKSSEMLTKNLSTVESLRKEIQALYEEGFVDELEVDRIQLTEANLKAEVSKASRQYSSALKALKFEVGISIEDQINLTDEIEQLLENNDFVPTAKLNYEDRKDYQILSEQTDLRKYDVAQRRAAYFPSLSAFASYGYNRQGVTFDEGVWTDVGIVGVRLNVPIFDGLQTRVRVEEALLTKAKHRIEMERNEYGMTLQVQRDYANYLNTSEVFENNAENLKLAEKIVDKVTLMYREGLASSNEFLQAEQDYTTAALNYKQAAYELLTAKLNLQFSTGQF